jgi:RNA polymerase sigma factor (sigma-70 family)
MEQLEIYKLIKYKFTKVRYWYTLTIEEREDLIHNTFIEVWDKVLNGTLSDRWENYIFIACRNNCITYLRKRNKLLSNKLPVEAVDYSLEEKFNDPFKNEQLLRCKEFLLSKLNLDIDKQVIQMRMEGIKIADIGKELDLSDEQVDKIISNVKYTIYKKLNNEEYFRKIRNFTYVVTDKSGQKKEFTRKLDVASFLKTGAHKIEKIILEGKHKDYLVERYYNKHKFKKK